MLTKNQKGNCLLQFWHSRQNKKIACPLCRADMNLLISNSSNDTSEEENEDLNNRIKKEIDQYNKLFSNKPQNVIRKK